MSTVKPARLVLEAWRGAPLRQPFKVQSAGVDLASSGWTLQLLVWAADGAPDTPLLTLDQGSGTDTRIQMDGSGNLVGEFVIVAADVDGLPTGTRPESRQPVLFRIGFLVTAPAEDPTYYALGDLRAYPRWGVESLPGATATGSQVVLDVDAQTITYDIGAGAGVATAAAELAEDYALKDDDYVEATNNSAKSWAIGGTGNGQPSAGSAKNWAQLAGAFVTGSLLSAKEWAVGTFKRGVAGYGSAKDWATLTGATADDADYSAKEHAVGTTVGTGSAKSWAQLSAAFVTGSLLSAKEWAVGTFKRGVAGYGSAKDWATLTGATADDADYSAKEHAVGTTVGSGSAKNWAQQVGAAVVTGLYSAREWATGTFTRGAAGGGSAKDWSTYLGGTVDNAEYSAKHYAAAADSSATTAENAIATVLGSAINAGAGLLDLTPAAAITALTYTITDADDGKLLPFTAATQVIVYVDTLAAGFRCGVMKAGAGDVSVFPGIAGSEAPDALLTLTTQWAEAQLRQVFDAVHVLQGGEAELPDIGLNRFLFNQAGASGLAFLAFA